jgi:hypothetical protein
MQFFFVFLTTSQLLLYVYHLVETELERDERLRLHTLARLVHDADRNAAELILRTTWQRRSSARLQEMVPHLLAQEEIQIQKQLGLSCSEKSPPDTKQQPRKPTWKYFYFILQFLYLQIKGFIS